MHYFLVHVKTNSVKLLQFFFSVFAKPCIFILELCHTLIVILKSSTWYYSIFQPLPIKFGIQGKGHQNHGTQTRKGHSTRQGPQQPVVHIRRDNDLMPGRLPYYDLKWHVGPLQAPNHMTPVVFLLVPKSSGHFPSFMNFTILTSQIKNHFQCPLSDMLICK